MHASNNSKVSNYKRKINKIVGPHSTEQIVRAIQEINCKIDQRIRAELKEGLAAVSRVKEGEKAKEGQAEGQPTREAPAHKSLAYEEFMRIMGQALDEKNRVVEKFANEVATTHFGNGKSLFSRLTGKAQKRAKLVFYIKMLGYNLPEAKSQDEFTKEQKE
ncbi:MAG: hypothetical protein N3G22_01350 [Candidatus Micrarchaeota archaeon]|nr:hypothetical protein [Candidatus Micrarchaeota archaeon]